MVPSGSDARPLSIWVTGDPVPGAARRAGEMMTQRELWLRVYADVFTREWENPSDPYNRNSGVPGIAARAADTAVDGAAKRGPL